MAFQPGERVGDYEVLSVLGAGGMGKVYKVRNVISDRVEAMKVLLPDFLENPDLSDRFMREIKVQASMSHPNIAQLHTAMRHGSEMLMLMEFVEGTPVDHMLKWGPVPPVKATAYAVQVLQALSYAHARGIIHRDIKPANIMVCPDGTTKLLDFGIARMKAEKRLTQSGVTVGSLYYMSPEQIQGAELDARSDLYSLGITLYEMVTGKRPFDAVSDFSIMSAHLTQDPVPPIQIDPSVPQVLNDIILMATARDPGKRFQSSEAFGVALSNVKREPGLATSTFTAPKVGEELPPTAPPPPRTVRGSDVPVSPMPVPVASPTQVTKPSSSRGLYMAIGSLATVAVIVVGAIQIPKYLRARADQDSSQIAAQGTQPQQPAQAGNPATATVPPSDPGAQASSPASSMQTATDPVQIPKTTSPVQQKSAPAQTASQAPATQTASPPAQSQQQTVQQPQSPPVVVPQQPPAQQPQQVQQPPSQPAVNTAELETVRDRMMKLAARVGAVQQKARALESSLRSQGLGMRSDVVSGVSRMTHYMDETENALRSNNADSAKTALRRADQETETLERILGII